jgi:hypothetical protein
LPREVKTPLRININNNPAFARSRLFEFTPNTDGSNDGPRIGWQWASRGYAVVQDETKFPCKLKYVCSNSADNGATITLYYHTNDGSQRTATLTGANTGAALSADTIANIDVIERTATTSDCYLVTDNGAYLARYYGDEITPEYRVIKLSQTGVAIRMMFRRHVPPTYANQTDIIPFHSRLAIIHAAKTVRYLQKSDYQNAALSAQSAEQFAKDEQASRDEAAEISTTLDTVSARNENINTLDSLICADVYDEASQIWGPVGREKLFDVISLANQQLKAMAEWDCTIGVCDIWKPDTSQIVTAELHRKGSGVFTLPRYVGTIIGVQPMHERTIPRNRWFEFHLNGIGQYPIASRGTWDDCGTTCIAHDIPLDSKTKKPIPHKIAAYSGNALDAGQCMKIYGKEIDPNGCEVEVYRNGCPGYSLVIGSDPHGTPPADCPAFTAIDGVMKPYTQGFVTLHGWPPWSGHPDYMFGYYYPDDREPRYRRI